MEPDRFDQTTELGSLSGRIDWRADPEGLRRGNLASLAPDIAEAIRTASGEAAVTNLATILGIDPVVVVIALLARCAAEHNRTAARIGRVVLKKAPADEVNEAMAALGLPGP